MDVVINGESRALPDGATVSAMLTALQVAPGRVVVEVNLAILKRAEHATTALKDGDRVEIVEFVGGGADSGNT
jgi:sulfur carrier protein